MKYRKLISLIACAVAVASTALAEVAKDDIAIFAADAKDAETEFHAYLADTLKAGQRPDFSKPPASSLLRRAFNLKQLQSLPPPQGSDLPWLADWTSAANGVNKAIMLFGIPPGTDPMSDPAALNRNVIEYEEQVALAMEFLLRITAREFPSATLFMDGLPPKDRTPIRIEGFNKMRAGDTQMVGSDIGWITAAKPANARVVSGALRDTADVRATAMSKADRDAILALLQKVKPEIKDDETLKNLSAFEAALNKTK